MPPRVDIQEVGENQQQDSDGQARNGGHEEQGRVETPERMERALDPGRSGIAAGVRGPGGIAEKQGGVEDNGKSRKKPKDDRAHRPLRTGGPARARPPHVLTAPADGTWA